MNNSRNAERVLPENIRVHFVHITLSSLEIEATLMTDVARLYLFPALGPYSV